ncbi:MAG: amylo-alpha-1,6-glucosidase [Bacteroidetes bacterium 4572_77]|nr:MAG: amylo-alpha-1,6-glucosidase [Bacteroidetes bacterium 4572_77]
MSYLGIEKDKLTNLQYALKLELLRTNRSGSYSSSTVVNCNTRKYHGLLVVPQKNFNDVNHVLLSSADVTIVQHEAEFNLGIHKYKSGEYAPKGHKYISSFESDPMPKLRYRVGGVVFTVERVFGDSKARIMIKYTLEEAHSPTKIKISPFLAFRSIHELTKENPDANTNFEEVENGIKMQMYPNFTPLYMQFSKKPDYVHNPVWNKGIEYTKEINRGYEGHEDLLVPGSFEFEIQKGESIYFQAGIVENSPRALMRNFRGELRRRVPRNSFENNLENSAQQFIMKDGILWEISAGLPWFGRRGRDTLISLAGLTLVQGDARLYRFILNSLTKEMKNNLYPVKGKGDEINYLSSDTTLWFFRSLQQYIEFTGDEKWVWRKYGGLMKNILNTYRNGIEEIGLYIDEQGLLYAEKENTPLTWMDAVLHGKAVTQRPGYAVEVNALWYNAIAFTMELAVKNKDAKFILSWRPIQKVIDGAFIEKFTHPEKDIICDYVYKDHCSWAVRPNMLFAVSLPYSPLDTDQKKKILDVVQQELLTPRGIRTLSPKNVDYKSVYEGDIEARDLAYHQGTAWPWLLGAYVEAYIKIYGKAGLVDLKKIVAGFEEEMMTHGIGTISELYNGDPPHHGKGTISQAWSVAEMRRIVWLINKAETE